MGGKGIIERSALIEKPKNFFRCEKCGKILIERKENGLWYFRFGYKKDDQLEPYVEIYIHGNLKMKCLRRSGCEHWNVLNYLPFQINSA